MAKKAVEIVPRSESVAAKLYEVESKIAEWEEARKILREELLSSLAQQGVKSLKLANGDSYTVYPLKTVKVTNERAALSWAYENPEARMKIDPTKLKQAVEIGGVKFAKITVEDHLRVNRAKKLADSE